MKGTTNITISVTGTIATITIDLAQNHGPSASGKTDIVASTQGNKEIESTGVILGLNAYRKKK